MYSTYVHTHVGTYVHTHFHTHTHIDLHMQNRSTHSNPRSTTCLGSRADLRSPLTLSTTSLGLNTKNAWLSGPRCTHFYFCKKQTCILLQKHAYILLRKRMAQRSQVHTSLLLHAHAYFCTHVCLYINLFSSLLLH